MAVTRINNNQISDASAGNAYLGINAAVKLQNYSVTATKIANNLTYGSDLTITGNLTIQGNTTTVDTTYTTIEDPVILLASNQTGSPAVDIGFIGERGTSQNIAFVWDESASEFVTVYTNDAETNTTVSISSYASFHTNDANIGGNIVVNGTSSLIGNVLGNINGTGNINYANGYFTGNVSVLGTFTSTSNIVANASGIFYGDPVTGNGAIYAGVPGYTVLGSNVVVQFAGNANSYSQINFQNINNGTLASTDFIATADNGDDSNYYIDVGINSSTFNDPVGYPGFFPNDSYVHNHGGNLILNPETAGKTIKMMIGGTDTTDIVANVSSTGFDITGVVSATGNITGANVNSNAQIVATGNITGGNLNTAGQVVATGNVTGGNLVTAGLGSFGTTVTATGNITGGNLVTGGIVSATGNIVSAANVNGANVNASANVVSVGVVATGNVTGGNLLTAGIVSATGNIVSAANVNGANLNASANVVSVGVVASGNITGGNINTAGAINADTLNTTGNAVIAGNLFVLGNITYNNVEDLRIEDPVIILGTGPNGAPLTNPDSYDRGTFMEYYTSARGNAWMGWQNSSGNMIAAANVTFSGNNIVSVNAYGTFQAGNIYAQSSLITGNVTGGNLLTGGVVNATGNIVSVANVNGANVNASANVVSVGVVASGNITGGNLLTGGIVSATGNIVSAANVNGANVNASANVVSVGVVASGNITGGNLLTGGVVNATGNIVGSANVNGANVNASANVVSVGVVASGNITGGNLLTAGIVSATGNIVSAANVNGANLNASANVVTVGVVASGNITGGNLLTAGVVTATGNITGGNLVTPNLVSATAVSASGNITGANVNTGGANGLTLNASTINSNASRIVVNSNSSAIDFAVNGTVANVFYINGTSNTASFGNSTQTTNALVAFNATTSVLMPVGSTSQRPGTGVTGMLRFNSTTNGLEVFDNSQWATVGTPTFTVIADDQFVGDGVTVAFTLSSSSYTTNSVIVSINGIVQIPTTAYSVSGATLTFTEAPQTGDLIDVREIVTTTQVTSISNSPGNAVVSVNPTINEINITGNVIPVSNATQSLGSATNTWKSLYVAGNTIYLGGLQLTASGNTFTIYQSDGVTQANIDVGSIDVSAITSGTSAIGISGTNGNAYVTVGGTSNVAVWATTGQYITGLISASGNITGGNLTTAGQVSATGNITGGNLSVGTGTITVNNIVNGGANGAGNIGSSTTYFNTVFAKATSAQYADLAENYAADAEYAPGTVLTFGGANEVTVSAVEGDRRIAGVVSTNPSYIMNSTLESAHVATIALTGRVPTFVSGPVEKGDMMVSAGNGRAVACATPAIGTVIGKALEDHAGGDGVIEVVVGRL